MREVGAVGVPDDESGEAVKIVVVRKDGRLTDADLIAHCRQHLTGYKTPRHVEFRETLPRSPIGKILRRELKEKTEPMDERPKEAAGGRASEPPRPFEEGNPRTLGSAPEGAVGSCAKRARVCNGHQASERGRTEGVRHHRRGRRAAGCAVAARLAQFSPDFERRADRGGPGEGFVLSDVPLGIAALVPFRSARNYAYETTPQTGLRRTQGLPAARTRASAGRA